MHYPTIFRPFAARTVTLTTASTNYADQAVAFGTKVVRLSVNGATGVFYRLNAAATVNGTSLYLPPNIIEYIFVGDGDTVNAICSATGSVLNITEMGH